MSKIQAELSEATGVKIKRGQDRQEFILALITAISALSDKEWDGLSKDAQDWNNDAVDARAAKKKTLPDFPDLDEEEEVPPEEKPARRGSKAAPDDEVVLKTGCTATLVTKRDKTITGKVVEFDEDMIVLDIDGKEEEFDRSRLASVTVVADKKASKPAKEEDDGPGVGDQVMLTTARGKEVTGKILEMDDEVVVLETDDGEEEFTRERVKSLTPVKASKTAPAKKAVEEAPAKPSRRAAKDDADDETPAKPKRSSNPEGVSVGSRIKELIAEDLEATEADIAKALKKEGIEFKENTLKLNYVDSHKFITILKAAKRLK